MVVHPVLWNVFVSSGRLCATDVTLEEVTRLLAKEATNGFCVMAPPNTAGERRVRGTGVYVHASRFNHGARAKFVPACSTAWLGHGAELLAVATGAHQRVFPTLRGLTTSTTDAKTARSFIFGCAMPEPTVYGKSPV